MTDTARRDALERMATDPAFAARVRTDPDAVARELGLSADDIAALAALGQSPDAGGAALLGERLSKSALAFGGTMSALFGHHAPDAGFTAGLHPAQPEFTGGVHPAESGFDGGVHESYPTGGGFVPAAITTPDDVTAPGHLEAGLGSYYHGVSDPQPSDAAGQLAAGTHHEVPQPGGGNPVAGSYAPPGGGNHVVEHLGAAGGDETRQSGYYGGQPTDGDGAAPGVSLLDAGTHHAVPHVGGGDPAGDDGLRPLVVPPMSAEGGDDGGGEGPVQGISLLDAGVHHGMPHHGGDDAGYKGDGDGGDKPKGDGPKPPKLDGLLNVDNPAAHSAAGHDDAGYKGDGDGGDKPKGDGPKPPKLDGLGIDARTVDAASLNSATAATVAAPLTESPAS
ncbi:MAG: hypothetical protein ACTHMS_01525 [Jatrophihabitans sp.]|uniref:hypothetical protein n=1 Tax=Jatrophihabitans sp. TaxID=1932789 RepID=UPI003F7E7EFC